MHLIYLAQEMWIYKYQYYSHKDLKGKYPILNVQFL